jgi:UDP-2,3-diacylglucosamine pyrophosphatase LpxH
MNYNSVWIKEDKTKIIALGDVHIGSPQSKFQELKEFIKQQDENTYFVFIGDLMDNAIVDSVSDIYRQTHNPSEAMKEVEELFHLTKGRTLGVVSGNHEQRTKRKVGIDMLEIICEYNNIPYANDILVLDINVGTKASYGSAKRINYIFVLGHGITSARSVGGKITANARISEVVANGDVYITGHTHQPSIVKLNKYIADKRNKNLLELEYYVVTVPSWVGYDEYAGRMFLKPSAFGHIEVELSGLAKDIQVIMR